MDAETKELLEQSQKCINEMLKIAIKLHQIRLQEIRSKSC